MSHVPEYQHADAHDQIRRQRTYGGHVDQLLEVEDRRQYAWVRKKKQNASSSDSRARTFRESRLAKRQKKMNLPAPSPHTTEAMTGVLVLSLTVDRKPNSRPSLDMEYRIRGNGNTHPNKLSGPRGYIDNKNKKIN